MATIKQPIGVPGHDPVRGRVDGKLRIACSCGWMSPPDKGSMGQWTHHLNTITPEDQPSRSRYQKTHY